MPGPPACAVSVLVGGLRDVGMPTAGVAARKLPVLRSHSASCPGALSVCQTRISQAAVSLKYLISDVAVSFRLLGMLDEQASAQAIFKSQNYLRDANCAPEC